MIVNEKIDDSGLEVIRICKKEKMFVANSFAPVMQYGTHKGPNSITHDRVTIVLITSWFRGNAESA